MKNIKIKFKPFKMSGKISFPKEAPAQTAVRLQDESRKRRAEDKQNQSGSAPPSK
jgi:hypothetical protein